MGKTTIGWTDETWNPVTGCTKVSAGCKHCYAERLMPRLGQAFSEIRLHPDRLDAPRRWRGPRRVFVNSMSDLFHERVPASFIIECFEAMAACPQHTFQILTKRPERVESVLYGEEGKWYLGGGDWLPNVWLGFSAEDQPTYDARLACFAMRPGEQCAWSYAIHLFVSAEPLLGPIQLFARSDRQPQWVIVGGESGAHARPCDIAWIRSVVEQCRAAGVPCFVKQDSGPRPGRQGRIPDDLWAVKEWP